MNSVIEKISQKKFPSLELLRLWPDNECVLSSFVTNNTLNGAFSFLSRAVFGQAVFSDRLRFGHMPMDFSGHVHLCCSSFGFDRLFHLPYLLNAIPASQLVWQRPSEDSCRSLGQAGQSRAPPQPGQKA
jgi:hypothetical protein